MLLFCFLPKQKITEFTSLRPREGLRLPIPRAFPSLHSELSVLGRLSGERSAFQRVREQNCGIEVYISMDAVTVEFAETELYKYGRPFCMRVKKKKQLLFHTDVCVCARSDAGKRLKEGAVLKVMIICAGPGETYRICSSFVGIAVLPVFSK